MPLTTRPHARRRNSGKWQTIGAHLNKDPVFKRSLHKTEQTSCKVYDKVSTAEDAGKNVETRTLIFNAVITALNSVKAVGILIMPASFDTTRQVQTQAHFSPHRKQDQPLNAVIRTVVVHCVERMQDFWCQIRAAPTARWFEALNKCDIFFILM